jgi:hypothetical protein
MDRKFAENANRKVVTTNSELHFTMMKEIASFVTEIFIFSVLEWNTTLEKAKYREEES